MLKLLLVLLTVFTTYNKGNYHTQGEVLIEQSIDSVNHVVDHFAYDLQTDITQLFSWAFVGTGKLKTGTEEEKKQKDAIEVRYKETYYDPITHYGKLVIDVIVPGFRTFKNMTVESLMTDSTTDDNVRHARIDIHYSGSLLKMANGVFHIKQLEENLVSLSMDLNVRFGFFFNLFVTQKVYKNVLEWRLDAILGNLKEQAETGQVTDRRLTQFTESQNPQNN